MDARPHRNHWGSRSPPSAEPFAVPPHPPPAHTRPLFSTVRGPEPFAASKPYRRSKEAGHFSEAGPGAAVHTCMLSLYRSDRVMFCFMEMLRGGEMVSGSNHVWRCRRRADSTFHVW
eukprot:scaffold188_cov107-Isochrysis_galbana.AAC.24